MNIAITFFLSMLSLIWSIITSLKLQIVVVSLILLEAMEVDPVYADKIMLVVGVIWIIIIVKPLVEFVRTFIGK